MGIQKAQDDAYELIAEMLGAIERIEDPSAVHGNLRKRLDSKLRELQTAINQVASVNDGEFDPDLPKFAEKVRQLKVLSTSGISPAALQERINNLRQQMTDELEQVLTSPRKGHKALAKWVIHEDDEIEEQVHVAL